MILIDNGEGMGAIFRPCHLAGLDCGAIEFGSCNGTNLH
jgi:hypothetical protein